MTKSDGGPAFPHTLQYLKSDVSARVYGMSLRDWFAGQAVMAIMQNEKLPINTVAAEAYQMADAMLTERQKGGEG